MDHAQILKTAASDAHNAGKLSAAQRDQVTAFVAGLDGDQRRALVNVAAFDWAGLLKLLPLLTTFIPGIGPIIAIIVQLLPFILSLLNQNGGGDNPPDPN